MYALCRGQVIEMTQVTPASDIWSVGCLIIELLTGYPPYYDLQPMSALFRIVQVRAPQHSTAQHAPMQAAGVVLSESMHRSCRATVLGWSKQQPRGLLTKVAARPVASACVGVVCHRKS